VTVWRGKIYNAKLFGLSREKEQ